MYSSQTLFRFIPLFTLLLSLLCVAQPGHAEVAASASASVAINSQELDKLISTLENDNARKAFVANLKTLHQAYRQQEIDGLQIVELIGLNDVARSWLQQYEDFIVQHGLNSSALGKLGLTVGTLLVLLAVVILLRSGRKRVQELVSTLSKRYHLHHQHYHTQIRFLHLSALLATYGFAFFTLLVVWGLAEFSALTSDTGRALLSTTLNIFLVMVLAFVLWEICNGLIETALRRADGNNTRRLQTLLPVARNVLLMVFGVVFSLMILSELGIEIMPLLAGAGIVGIAVGFGAQTLVRDFLSGFMVILEDLIQVGDVVTIAGHSGLVEKITIRKVELRDLEGIVHTVPFSQITIIENRTKDFSCYVLDIGIAYREDTDEVIGLLREIDEGMRNDPNIGPHMLGPLEIFGVDRFADSAVIIKGRLKTVPLKQWDVGREFNRRMKQMFDRHQIEIPFPHQTVYFGQDKSGKAPPASVRMESSGSRQEATDIKAHAQ